jgi:hypothetical protein
MANLIKCLWDKSFGLQPACTKGLFFALLCLAVPTLAQAQFEYTVTTNNTATITGYEGPFGTVVIPNTTNGYPVTAIGYGAFEDNPNLANVIIPDSVDMIGDLAFEGCYNLTNVSIGSGVTNIGGISYAFGGHDEAEDNAFLFCTNLIAISVGSANPVYSSTNGVMFDKAQTTLVAFPGGLNGNYTIPNSVTNIGYEAFACSTLNNITLDGNITSIGNYAFEDCSNLISIVIPNSVASIGNFSFLNCANLASVFIGSGVTNIGGGIFTFEGRVAPNSYTFAGCSNLTSAYFEGNAPTADATVFSGDPATVFYLPEATGWGTNFGGAPTALWQEFTYTTNDDNTLTLTRYIWPGDDVTIPEMINGYTVTGIGYGTFFGNGVITNVTIPENITSIGIQAFCLCSGLTNIFIPDSVTNIGIGAFQECFNLTAITVDSNNPAYTGMNGVLFDKNLDTIEQYPGGLTGDYSIPNTVTTIGVWAFFGLPEPTNIIIPNTVTNIESSAFTGCRGLTNIFIPESVINIGASALEFCPNLAAINVDPLNSDYSSFGGILFDKSQTILLQYPGGGASTYVIPNGVTTIGDSAFLDCNLTNVTIPNSVTNIGFNAFSQCGLTNVTIPDSVTTIGPSAFGECFNLTNVVMSANLTSIGDYAFFECSNLAGIYFPGDAPSFQYDTGTTLFESDGNLTLYYLPRTTGWKDFSEATGIPIAPWLPQMQTGDGSFGIQTNQFGFNISWASGQTVVVDACTNLLNPAWQPVQTNTLTNCSVYFSDTQWTNYPTRYYQIHSQ